MVPLNTLLLRSESETLDFKRDNYAFVGASDEQKAELLKDILALANAWKEADAYIVIGVLEEHGRASAIVGAGQTLADHDVHQFVNSKTNRPVAFGIENVQYDGKPLTMILVDKVQGRPIYLRKRYGELGADTVYIRHGSSTAVASPDEIKEMGKAEQPIPALADVSLHFEIEIATWQYEGAFGLGPHKETREVDLLRIIAANDGRALAQFIQGKVTLPRAFLLDYLDRKNAEESLRNPASTEALTLSFSNQLREPTANIYMKPNPLEWKPLSPGMQLCLFQEKFIPCRTRLKELGGLIEWELAVDSCPLKRGYQKLDCIVIVDRR